MLRAFGVAGIGATWHAGRMSRAKLQSTIADAISRADSSYFNEDYSKQAAAVLVAIEKAGYSLLPKELPESVWAQVAKEMRTGRVRPEEHVKDVVLTALRLAGVK